MATIYLVRHGQASFGSADYDQLSELGARQADATGEYFARCGIGLDAAYSGDLSRQIDTCERVLAYQSGDVRMTVDSRFNEINNDEQVRQLAPLLADRDPEFAGLLERLNSSKDYQKVIRAVFNHWVSNDCAAHGIQSWADYSDSATAALRDVMASQGKGKTTAIFTSGGTIATLVAHVLGLPETSAYDFYEPVFNCSVTQLFYSGDNVSLSYYNDRSFLQLLGSERGENLVSYR
jgi:broad specificity phosphatase PhoE